ncbi:MAG: NUDIX hydrolase [Bryobacteraceae bacterium]
MGSSPTSRPTKPLPGGPSLNPWKRLSTRIAYENPWIRVREDAVIRPDGNPGIYGVIELRPSVAIVAINDQNEVALVGQWRYPTNSYSWEIPRGGSLDDEHDLEAAARRELLEETGLEADHWRNLGDLDLCNGVLLSTERVYIATSLRQTAHPPDPAEPIELKWVPFPTALDMILKNEIREATTVAALLKTSAALAR